MFGLSKREKLIKMIEQYKDYLHSRTSLYSILMIIEKDNISVNEKYINELSDGDIDKWYNEVKNDLEWHNVI